MKYSINGTGNIVAERDIYSLGGFIPKGNVGGKIASEAQLSQDGECWLARGDISTRPDIVIKDNAYVGTFTPGVNPVHTDGVTEFSGNTLIPGNLSVRSFVADTKNNVFIKDSFIGVSMDVLCGPEATATAFPFGQGSYDYNAAKGTLFENMVVTPAPTDTCRSFADLRLGKNTYLYVPSGYNAVVLWGYYDTSGKLAYSGERLNITQAFTKLSHPIYNLCRLVFGKSGGLTPAQLGASGAKIIGHISGSLLMDLRPESVSGQYVIDNSSFIMNTDNFGLATTQVRFLAGSMYDTTMYTRTNRQDYKPYGTFRNVERLEYDQYLADAFRTNVNRDTFISGFDCPLLRINEATFNNTLTSTGDLVLRRCILPKGRFTADRINGNTYEDLDFSYANDFIGKPAGNRTLVSSHRQGLYNLYATSGVLTGLVSYPENTKNATSITEKHVNIPLDGDLIEQGTYTYTVGGFYEDLKTGNVARLRTGKPLPTEKFDTLPLPSGWKITSLMYLDNEFKIRGAAPDPTAGISKDYPFFLAHIGKDPEVSTVSVSEFIALNASVTVSDYNVTPEITGSAYVGAGVTVRGDVKLIGDPYVNRVFDVNMWERGNCQPTQGGKWQDGFFSSTAHNRYRSKDLIPVEPGGTVSRTTGGKMVAWFFDDFGNRTTSGGTGWVTSFVVPADVYFVGVVLDVDGDGLVIDSDIPLANVKYVRAFGKRRYITNELDRTSPKDILLGPDFFEQGSLSIAAAKAGKPYEELKIGSPYRIRLKRPFGLGAGYRVTFSSVYSFGSTYYDAVTKLLYDSTSANMNNALFALAGSVADSPTAAITPADVTAARLVIEFVPTPRIVVPYGTSGITITGMKIRMYDNAVLSKNINTPEELILKGDAVVSHLPGGCVCGWGDSDAIVKL